MQIYCACQMHVIYTATGLADSAHLRSLESRWRCRCKRSTRLRWCLLPTSWWAAQREQQAWERLLTSLVSNITSSRHLSNIPAKKVCRLTLNRSKWEVQSGWWRSGAQSGRRRWWSRPSGLWWCRGRTVFGLNRLQLRQWQWKPIR